MFTEPIITSLTQWYQFLWRIHVYFFHLYHQYLIISHLLYILFIFWIFDHRYNITFGSFIFFTMLYMCVIIWIITNVLLVMKIFNTLFTTIFCTWNLTWTLVLSTGITFISSDFDLMTDHWCNLIVVFEKIFRKKSVLFRDSKIRFWKRERVGGGRAKSFSKYNLFHVLFLFCFDNVLFRYLLWSIPCSVLNRN